MPTPGATAELLSFDAFCRAEEAWDELVLAGDEPVPFMGHTWIRLWWEHFGQGQQFAAPVIREGDRWVAAVPLAIRRARFAGFSATVAEIVGTGPVPTRGMGLSDKADLVVRKGAQGARERLVVEMLRLLDRVDVFDIKGFDSMSGTGPALEAAAPRLASARTLLRSQSPYLELGEWDVYLRSRSRNFRKHLKKYWRLLEQDGPMELDRLEPGGDAAAWVRQVFEVNGKSWKAERGTNLFRAPEIRGFFAELVPALSERGQLDLRMIRLAGKPAVYELCFDYGGRLFSYNGAYRRELQRASPGTALTASVIEAACGRGRTEYDMLRGSEEYKLRWSDTARSELQTLIPADRPASRARAWLGVYLKARLKQSERLEQLGDRLSGAASRLRYRG